MILWTLSRVTAAKTVTSALVATDNADIAAVVRSAGGTVIMTSADLPSGSDRVAAAVTNIAADIIVNIQGDEPLIDPLHIDAAVKALQNDAKASVSTLACPIASVRELWDENAVKVVVDSTGRAVYFSRMPIPYPGKSSREPIDHTLYLRHIGLYAFRREYLFEFTQGQPCWTEKVERLEQLRILHAGGRIAVALVDRASPGIDTPEDLARLEEYLRMNEIKGPGSVMCFKEKN
jgi:3-deoxy-manno-octulosonate cytidylyltransferase (CMP-KDO synthetase)